MVLSSCDDTSPAADDPVISDTLDEVAEILTGDGTGKKDKEPKPEVEPPEGDKPERPTAKPVPDKPGFVISPFNGKWIDVTGIAPGTVVADPDFPAEEKKYFIVPEPPPAEPPADPAPEGNETPSDDAMPAEADE